jgi:hypothetical protein
VTTLGPINITASACGANYGVVNVNGTLTFHDGSTFTNNSGANFRFAADVGLALAAGSSNPTFTNAGTLAKIAGTGVSNVAIDVNNSGAVVAYTGTLEFSGPTNSFTGTIQGAGTVLFGGGASAIGSGAKVSVSHWSISGTGTSATLGENLFYSGAFSEGAGSVLSLTGGYLALTGSASLAGTVNGSNRVYTEGTTTVSGLTIGGTAILENTAFTTQSGGGLALGDSSGAAAFLSNTSKATYDIADNSGIGHGASKATYINNTGLFEKTGGTGTSTISPSLYNAGTVSVSSGLLDFAGAVSGTGADTISGAATLEFDSTLGSGQTINFTGSGGQLDILNPQGFLGKIANFGATDTLEVAGPWVFEGFTQQTGMGTLNFANGSNDIAITLLGTYTGSFAQHAGPNGSTLITYT